MNVLQQKVLVLNRNWQAVNQVTVAQAISAMAADAFTALEIEGKDCMRPVRWSEWLTLPVRDGDEAIHTVKISVRAPTVVVAVNYGGFPKRRPKFNLKGVAQRDRDTCQYTGRKLKPHERTMDHVVPLSRGGADHWTNVVLAHKDVNHAKGNRLNHEVGLSLRRQPAEPPVTPVVAFLQPAHPDHALFLDQA